MGRPHDRRARLRQTQTKRGSFRDVRIHASYILAEAALIAGIFAAFSPAAHAGEANFCVTCTGPDQTYLCQVTGEGSSQNDALKLYCVIRTAKEGHHASCSATSKVEGCNGAVKAYSYDGPSLPNQVAQDPRVKKTMEHAERDQAAKPKGDEPKTLVELTGRAMGASRRRWHETFGSTPQQSPVSDVNSPASPLRTASLPPLSDGPPSSTSRVKRAAQSASVAVGSAARTTYRCFRSLFLNCSGGQ
jgi:hypothetical protein